MFETSEKYNFIGTYLVPGVFKQIEALVAGSARRCKRLSL